MLLQRLWLTGLSLDEQLPAPIMKEWSTFESVLNIKQVVSSLAVLIFGNLKVRVAGSSTSISEPKRLNFMFLKTNSIIRWKYHDAKFVYVVITNLQQTDKRTLQNRFMLYPLLNNLLINTFLHVEAPRVWITGFVGQFLQGYP